MADVEYEEGLSCMRGHRPNVASGGVHEMIIAVTTGTVPQRFYTQDYLFTYFSTGRAYQRNYNGVLPQ